MANYRVSALKSWMEREGIDLVVIEDCEERRGASLRYLSGHPSDALFFLHSSGASLLVAWDLPMAELLASADALVAYTEFQRSPVKAIAGVARRFGLPRGAKIELPPTIPVPLYEEIRREAEEFTFLCHSEGAEKELKQLRSIKDAEEVEYLRRGTRITNNIIDSLVEGIRNGSFATEIDVALFIEAEARKAGAEGTGFESIVANPERSFGIHAHPAFSAGSLDRPGPTIIDFGVRVEGYTSDVTLTLLKSPLKPAQEQMAALVEEAYAEAEALLAPGLLNTELARRVDEIFAREGLSMPHSLGHGIGLDVHEGPLLRDRKDVEIPLKAGMVIAMEPGLYQAELGGIRKENDYLITETGAEKLTRSEIFRI